jgi:hypothetical protein
LRLTEIGHDYPATVAGSRANDPELIEVMTKISETRGYSALLRQIKEIETLTADPSPEEQISKAILLGCQKSADTPERRDVIMEEVHYG